jgi:hypothetical protein
MPQSELISLLTLSEFMWSCGGSCQPVCALTYFEEVRNTEAWNSTSWYTGCYITHPLEGISSGNGRSGSEREIASSSIKGVLMADGTANSLRYYCTCQKKHFSTKIWVPDWEFFGTGQKFHPSSTLS